MRFFIVGVIGLVCGIFGISMVFDAIQGKYPAGTVKSHFWGGMALIFVPLLMAFLLLVPFL